MPKDSKRQQRLDLIQSIVQGVRSGAQTHADAAVALERIVDTDIEPPFERRELDNLFKRLLQLLQAFGEGQADLGSTSQIIEELSEVASSDRVRFWTLIGISDSNTAH